MHQANLMYWQHCSDKYARYFQNPSSVIEFGSYDINGSIRQVFTAEDYTGLDWRPGPCVDVVSLAHEYDSGGKKYDTIVSASMLEHDPHWEASIKNMISMLKKDGILIMTWGAGLNIEHCLQEAPDGEFHNLKAGKVLNMLKRMSCHVHEFRYERLFADSTGVPIRWPAGISGMGEVGLVAFRNKSHATGDRVIDDLIPEDIE